MKALFWLNWLYLIHMQSGKLIKMFTFSSPVFLIQYFSWYMCLFSFVIALLSLHETSLTSPICCMLYVSAELLIISNCVYGLLQLWKRTGCWDIISWCMNLHWTQTREKNVFTSSSSTSVTGPLSKHFPLLCLAFQLRIVSKFSKLLCLLISCPSHSPRHNKVQEGTWHRWDLSPVLLSSTTEWNPFAWTVSRQAYLWTASSSLTPQTAGQSCVLWIRSGAWSPLHTWFWEAFRPSHIRSLRQPWKQCSGCMWRTAAWRQFTHDLEDRKSVV